MPQSTAREDKAMPPPPDRGNPKSFQEICIPRIVGILQGHGIDARLTLGEGSPTWYWTTFLINAREHRIEIYSDIAVMHQDDRYFECYMPEEFENGSTLIEGFATRLDRYLSGGPWEGPDEKGLPDDIKGRI
jgi:hypothetical protein